MKQLKVVCNPKLIFFFSLSENYWKNMESENSKDFVNLDVTNTSGNDTDYEYDYDYELEDSYSNFNWAELGPNVAIFAITFILG